MGLFGSLKHSNPSDELADYINWQSNLFKEIESLFKSKKHPFTIQEETGPFANYKGIYGISETMISGFWIKVSSPSGYGRVSVRLLRKDPENPVEASFIRDTQSLLRNYALLSIEGYTRKDIEGMGGSDEFAKRALTTLVVADRMWQ